MVVTLMPQLNLHHQWNTHPVALYFILITLLLAVLPQPTFAQDSDTEAEAPADAVTWDVTLDDLGLEPNVRLTGQIAQRDLFLPVPAGLTALELRAGALLSPDVTSGYLEVRSGNRELGVFELTPNTDELVIPLEDAPVQGGQIALSLLARLRSQDDICTTNLIGAWLLLESPVLSLAGDTQSSLTVGDFLPSILTELTLVVPAEPSAAEAEAALRTASAIATRYGAQQPTVNVVTSTTDAESPTPFMRTIVIAEGEAAGMTVDASGAVPVLTLGGSGDALVNSSMVLASRASGLVSAPSTAVLNITAPQQMTGERFTLAQLNQTNLQVTGIGRIELPITLSQSQFGGPVRSLSLRLEGAHTPVLATERGILSILVNGVLVDAMALGGSGSFSTTVDIPASVLQRDNTVIAQFDYVSQGGNCTIGYGGFTGQISGGSVVTIQRGQGLAAGFHRLPQVLASGFSVAFDPLTADSLASAVALVDELQRVSDVPLSPDVVTWDEAVAASGPVVLVTSSATNVDNLTPPLMTAPLRVVGDNGAELLRLDAETNFAALQAFEQNGRDVLLAQTTEDPASLTALLNSGADGWYDLQGDVIVAADGATPFSLRLRGGEMVAVPDEAPEPSWWVQYQAVIYVAIVVVVLLLVALTFPRVVRKRPS
jgi:hypothetical protein